MRVAVVGGGIAGLAAAWELRHRADVTVFEPDHLGGKLRSEEFEGRTVDCGPDAFLTRVPQAVALARELGLGDELIAPGAGQAMLWWGDRLRPLPEGLVLGVPRRVGPLLRSGLLTPGGIIRAGADLLLPRRTFGPDVSVHELIASRFGSQVAARLVDPLLGGIHAGRTEELSAAATAPQLLAAARRSRSLMLGLRAAPPPAPGPVFLAPKGGLQVLADRLVTALEDHGTTFVPDQVTALHDLGGTAVGVDPDPATFDAVVLAVPAPNAAALLGATAPAELPQIRSASVALVTMAYDARELTVPTGVSGFLVPRPQGRLMTACSFASTKWPHWSSPGRQVLRISAGRSGDRRAMDLDDDSLVDHLAAEIGQALRTSAVPAAWRVSRWPASFPQYEVGHLEKVTRIEDQLRRAFPRVALAGASYRGSGIPACIQSGRQAAASLVG